MSFFFSSFFPPSLYANDMAVFELQKLSSHSSHAVTAALLPLARLRLSGVANMRGIQWSYLHNIALFEIVIATQTAIAVVSRPDTVALCYCGAALLGHNYYFIYQLVY
jgi:hypothetical protein